MIAYPQNIFGPDENAAEVSVLLSWVTVAGQLPGWLPALTWDGSRGVSILTGFLLYIFFSFSTGWLSVLFVRLVAALALPLVAISTEFCTDDVTVDGKIIRPDWAPSRFSTTIWGDGFYKIILVCHQRNVEPWSPFGMCEIYLLCSKNWVSVHFTHSQFTTCYSRSNFTDYVTFLVIVM